LVHSTHTSWAGMSKPLEAEKQGLDSPSEHTDTERNGPDTNHQNPQNKTSPFSVSPTGPSTKIKAEDPSGDSAPAAPPPPQPAQPHLPQAQLMLTGSQLAGVKWGRASPQEEETDVVA
uniref:POU class 2 homeobox 2 n=1 Tax=Ursus americanus TaxID=9643 RepID=A0A452R7U2_URSAM